MTDLAHKERQKAARSRAGRIRLGMVNYLETLAVIAQARAAEDHVTLGYASWAEYVDAEFGKDRLQLTAEMRQKAVSELRLAGASQREIGHTLGVSHTQVKRDLRGTNVPPEPARPPLVEALTGAIEDAAERAEDHRAATPVRTDQDPSEAVADTTEGSAVAPQDHPSTSSVATGEAQAAATASAADRPRDERYPDETRGTHNPDHLVRRWRPAHGRRHRQAAQAGHVRQRDHSPHLRWAALRRRVLPVRERVMTTTITASPSVAAVVAATRHLHDFRSGLAETLELLATRATEYMPDHGKAQLLPLLQVLGTERSHRYAERLYRIASDLTAGWQEHVDIDQSTETLHAVIHEAVGEVMTAIYRDVRCCCEITACAGEAPR